MKKIGFYSIYLAFLLTVIELSAWFFFTIFQERFTFFDVQSYLVSPEKQASMSAGPLSKQEYLAWGWDMNFTTPHGERPMPVSYHIPFIATFGDSFTQCDEVEDHQTWQTYLTELLQLDVYNFGVNAYGTDQAYLKFLSTFPELPTPIVFLGLTTENIKRIVNVYRPFYFLKTGTPLPKPRFILKDNMLVLIENPLRSREDVSMLGSPQFMQKIGKYDWWYNRDTYPILGFPYSKILSNKRMWLEAYYGKANRTIDDIDPRPWEELWDSEEVRLLMFKILDAFVEKAEHYQAIPVIIVLPLREQVEQQFITKEIDPHAAKLIAYCQEQGYRVVDTITALSNNVAEKKEVRRDLFTRHVSPKGNQMIANALHDYVQKEFPDLITQRRGMIIDR